MEGSTARRRVFLGAMFLIAIVVPIVLAPGDAVGPDIAAYSRIAQDQLSRPDFWSWPQAFDGNFWAMAYPTFLAALLRINGGSLAAVPVIQIVITATLVFVPWLLTRHLGGRTPYLATALVALNPALWWMGNSIGYEFLLAVSLSWSLVLAWLVATNDSANAPWIVVASIASGLLFALALLTQTKSLIVAPVIAYLLWRSRPGRMWWGAAGAALGLLPWMVRNLVVLGSPSPFTGNAGYNLWVGNNSDAVTGGSMLIAPPTPGGQSQMTAALEFIVSQPERFIDLIWSKAARLLQPVYVYPEILQPGPGRTLLHLMAGLLSVVLAVGLLVFLGARIAQGRSLGPGPIPNMTPMAVFVALFFVAHLPFIAEPRYMASVMPVTAAVAAATWVWVWNGWRGSRP